MSVTKTHLVYGPEDDNYIPRNSFGKIILDILKKRDNNSVINVDAVTEDTLTYGRLLKTSIKLSNLLKGMGLKEKDVIAVISKNTIDYFIPILAAFYLGIAVSTINPDYTVYELQHSLMISKPKLIFCSKHVLSNVIKAKEELSLTSTILLKSKCNNDANVQAYEDLLEKTEIDVNSFKPVEFDTTRRTAFITFSSGTTGLPKGVILTHDNLRSPINLLGNPKYGNATSTDTTIVNVPLFHMYGLMLQLLSLITHMKYVLINKFQPKLFLQSIEKYSVTKLYLVPSLLLFLAKNSLVSNYNLSSVRDIYVGAAPLSKELIRDITKKFPQISIKQNYGLTETSGPCFQDNHFQNIGSVGSPAPAIIAKVRDSTSNKTLGPLQVGEICIKGPAVMKGYIPNQNYLDEDGFLYSGDLGYYDHDGFFYVVDRIKELIKYKGFQVAPTELEALILTHPSVRDCGVIGIPDERAGELPLAFIVPKNGVSVTKQDIVDYVAERISIQKRLYGGVIFTEDIPRSHSGKITRRMLVQRYKEIKEH